MPGTKVEIQQFVLRRVRLEHDQRVLLGVQNSTLGQDFTIGRSVIDRSGRFRVAIGPVEYNVFEALMPGGRHHTTLRKVIEQFSRGQQKEPEQTMAFRRVLQTAVLHVQSAGRQEVQSGDVLAATLQQSRSYAAQLLSAQGVTRLDVLEYITHGIQKVPPAHSSNGDSEPEGDAEAGTGERGSGTSRDPLSAYALNLSARARAGELDPLIGRTDELQRTMESGRLFRGNR